MYVCAAPMRALLVLRVPEEMARMRAGPFGRTRSSTAATSSSQSFTRVRVDLASSSTGRRRRNAVLLRAEVGR